MNSIKPSSRFSTLMVLVLTLHVLAHGYILPKLVFITLQNHAACTASLMADDCDEQTHEADSKPPEQSFNDYSTFFSPQRLVPAYNPRVSLLMAYEPFRTFPRIFLEINVPPDSPA